MSDYQLSGTYAGTQGSVSVYTLDHGDYSSLIHILETEKPKYRMDVITEDSEFVIEEEGELK